ncbi:MAG: response regulator transcription factor [Firmicutes bacterium]|nr:response regulator transcription factor [Bacillota bacterium]
MSRIQIFIISDNQAMSSGLSAIFAAHDNFEIIGISDRADDAFQKIKTVQPDLILYGMRQGEKLAETVPLIKESCPYTKLFIFGSNTVKDELHTVFGAGIDGYIPQTMLPSHLVSVIELTCKAGVICLPGDLKLSCFNQTVTHADNSDGELTDDTANIKLPLTSRELEIYKLIVQNYSNKEIGNVLYISQPTVKTHVSSILRKLELKNRTKIILFEMKHRYLDCGDGPNTKISG